MKIRRENEKIHGCAVGTNGNDDSIIRKSVSRRGNRTNCSKSLNKQLTSYKAIKDMEIKEGEFEKTSTMKIKRYKELNKK